jgi:hypothetical protein
MPTSRSIWWQRAYDLCAVLSPSNVNQWVSVYMEYKFHNPIPTHLRGLADYLAHSIRESTLQKSSITANGKSVWDSGSAASYLSGLHCPL